MKEFKPHAWLLPQPVLIIGTYNADGSPNAMNAAWGGQLDAHQVMISIGKHATTENLNRLGDFSLTFATKDTMVGADFVGLVSGKARPDKIFRAGWKFVTGNKVNAPIFTDFPMTLECRIKDKIEESESGYCLVADILNVLCKDEYLAEDGKPNVAGMGLITFDPVHNNYISLGEIAGKAFHDGMKLK